MRLALLTTHFNPCGYVTPVANYVRFREALGPYPLLTEQAIFPGQEPIAHDARCHVATDRNVMWQKEALLNAAIRDLPPDYDAVAWIDADLLFDRPDWYEATCEALQRYAVVQMFAYIHYLGPDGVTVNKKAHGAASAQHIPTFRAPGGAIAVRREVVEDGLYDRHVCGGGDHVFMAACIGNTRRVLAPIHETWRAYAKQHCERIYAKVQGSVGSIPGVVRHLYHGTRANRQYVDRHQILIRHGYDPSSDVRVAENGLLEWASDKPEMHAEVAAYFQGRREDDQ